MVVGEEVLLEEAEVEEDMHEEWDMSLSTCPTAILCCHTRFIYLFIYSGMLF